MILPCCPSQKWIRNGKHLRLQPRIGQTRNGSSPQKRLHLLLRPQKPYQTTHSVPDLDVSVEGPPSLTHTPRPYCPHAQCIYKYKDKGVSPTTSLLAKKTKPPSRKKFAGSTSVKLANTSRQALKFIKSSQGSSSATPRKDPSEIKCWTCGQKGHYSSDCPSNTKSKWELRWPQM